MSYGQTYSAHLQVMMRAVHKAARGLVRDFGEIENLQVSKKGPGDFVSTADAKAERVLVEELGKARPGYGFLLEESGHVPSKDGQYRWIVDPLDGTTNFLHGFPYFCISIALEQIHPSGKGEIIAAVTHAPMQKETFWAEKGRGAWLESADNSQAARLRVSARTKLSTSLLCIGSLKREVKLVTSLGADVSGLRSLGSTALAMAYVAAGRFDAFAHQSGKLWDVAAGNLLVREAGGYITDFQGRVTSGEADLLATSEGLQFALLKVLPKDV